MVIGSKRIYLKETEKLESALIPLVGPEMVTFKLTRIVEWGVEYNHKDFYFLNSICIIKYQIQNLQIVAEEEKE